MNAVTSKWAKGTGGPAGDECQNLVPVFVKSKRAQSVDDDETWIEGGPAPTLNQFDQGDTRATVLAIAENQRNEISMTEVMGSLGSAGGGKPGGQGYPAVLTGASAVRRLTPLECERLQGWNDFHTAYGVDADGNTISISDSARYRMIGNGVASPVAAWIARHIANVEAQQ